MSDKPIFTSAEDVETAFYDAIERADLDAIMQLWAEDEDIVCVLPGSPRHVGYSAIKEAWSRVFDGSKRRGIQIQTVDKTTIMSPFSAIHTLIERVSLHDDEHSRAPVVATNVYVRGPLGWRLALHHASPAPPGTDEESPKTLH